MLPLLGGKQLCAAPKILVSGDHATTLVFFCLMGESGPQGHILIEVDDLATHGNVVHAENMVKLQKTFKFGKWKSIYNSEGDYAGRTVIQDKSYGFHIHQAMFVRERLSPFVIPEGRRSDKKFQTSDGEKRQLRAVWAFCQLGSTGDTSRCVGFGITWHGINQSKYSARLV